MVSSVWIINSLQVAGGAGLIVPGAMEIAGNPGFIDYFALVFGIFFVAAGSLGLLRGKLF
ncbi:MAG: hypothetical protein QHH04_08365 [Methanolinea sp.]|jgi:hypothetical protein|nr:hypothetical protein [Methanolinea sp.]